MTNETKNITFHVTHAKVSSKSRCSRTLPMNVSIESAHCGCERNSYKDWTRSKRCGKHGRIWSKEEHCIKVWYSDSRACLGKLCIARHSHHLCPNAPFHWRRFVRFAEVCGDRYGKETAERFDTWIPTNCRAHVLRSVHQRKLFKMERTRRWNAFPNV